MPATLLRLVKMGFTVELLGLIDVAGFPAYRVAIALNGRGRRELHVDALVADAASDARKNHAWEECVRRHAAALAAELGDGDAYDRLTHWT